MAYIDSLAVGEIFDVIRFRVSVPQNTYNLKTHLDRIPIAVLVFCGKVAIDASFYLLLGADDLDVFGDAHASVPMHLNPALEVEYSLRSVGKRRLNKTEDQKGKKHGHKGQNFSSTHGSSN